MFVLFYHFYIAQAGALSQCPQKMSTPHRHHNNSQSKMHKIQNTHLYKHYTKYNVKIHNIQIHIYKIQHTNTTIQYEYKILQNARYGTGYKIQEYDMQKYKTCQSIQHKY